MILKTSQDLITDMPTDMLYGPPGRFRPCLDHRLGFLNPSP